MAKRASTFYSMTVTLLLITLIAGVSLGLVNDITRGPKAQARLERKIKALKNVLPEFNNNPVEQVILMKMEDVEDSIELYPGKQGDITSGIAIVGASKKGFNGLVKVMVGFDLDGNIQNVEVLEQNETPGLGTKVKEDRFIQQFRGKNPSTFSLKVKKDQGEVDALTGATITTRAFNEAVQTAYKAFMEYTNIKSD